MDLGAMTINWDSYEIYDPGVFGPLRELPRAEARRAYDQLMASKATRIDMLRRLLAVNGVELSDTDDGLLRLDSWFFANVQPDDEKPGRLQPEWYSVVVDIALFLGDTMIARCLGLRWEFFIWGKTNVSYQHPVIMGFTQVTNPKINVNIVRGVAAYGHHIVASRGSIATEGKVTVRGVEIDLDAANTRFLERPVETGDFLRWVKNAESRA